MFVSFKGPYPGLYFIKSILLAMDASPLSLIL